MLLMHELRGDPALDIPLQVVLLLNNVVGVALRCLELELRTDVEQLNGLPGLRQIGPEAPRFLRDLVPEGRGRRAVR